MSREIKFRGRFKLSEGEWEYGGIRFGDMGQAYILPHGASHRVELVNRSTVGQFTGLKDKNGKEIYEGDVLENAHGFRREVKWERDGFGPMVEPQALEVIGNIYENPGLV